MGNQKMKFPDFQEVKNEILKVRNNIHPKQMEFYQDFYNTIINSTSNKVQVFSARCGIGKSTVIQAIVKVFARKKIGLIIATDSKDRLREIFNCDDEETKELLLNRVEDFSGKDSFKNHIKAGIHKPIALITTQKYFRLDDEFRENLFDYQKGKTNVGRNIVIFDERPYFFEALKISIETLNNINSTLHDGIDSSVKNKEWVIESFEKFTEQMKNAFMYWESQKEDSFTYFTRFNGDGFGDGAAWITQDDDKFFEFLNNNKDRLFEYDMNTYHDICAIKHFLQEGGIFESKKTKFSDEYGKSCTVVVDKRKYFTSPTGKVKFFVLDATANIDPIYGLSYVELIDCSKYNIKLDLELTFVHEQASKGRLMKVNDEYWEYCKKFIKRVTNNEETLVVTYKGKEKLLEDKEGKIHALHFGNVKGFNDFKDLVNMIQIGLNRAPNLNYFYTLCILEPDYYKQLKKDSVEQSIGRFRDINKGRIGYRLEFITRQTILTDFVQNLYRIAIRNYVNNKLNKVWLVYNMNTKEFKDGNLYIEGYIKHEGLIRKTYTISCPREFSEYKARIRKTKDGQATNVQKVLEWLDKQPKGRVFKLSDVEKELQLTRKQINKAKENHPEIKQRLSQMQIKKGIYEVP